ncbi:aminodeoxychorismate synthase component I [Cochlodiniinecator piscidefendens]|uniref:aminodeoxychorismate synthase component I n=1 Tax=Cochlodiniinecator piscidefendens TaxID=2715756 RepID=UPI001E4BA41F|nr:aminodeoxychorismate synthase component I [Cochlodiniinecator piscidefendens]
MGAGTVFRNPKRLIVAHTPEEVPGALVELARAQADGLWIAGYGSYELGYVMMPGLADLMPTERDTPLMAFGVFDAPLQGKLDAGEATLGPLRPTWDLARYRRAFETLKAYIGAGDTYQINLTFPIETEYTGDAQALYQQLVARQSVSHGAFVDLGVGPTILSRSPELFFRTNAQGQIETLPMKGTVARGLTDAEDEARKDWLHNDTKNRAENLMIVDLLRNDISQVSEIGSVKVPELYSIQSFATVHQMVSKVTAQLLPETSLTDIFRALFPCGSITGAPKHRAMQIIDELEDAPRGIYCGGIGWMAPDGASSFNVAIRTLSLFDGGRVRLNVGGGVVWDSTAPSEYEEALWKARYADLSPQG